jgi:chaperonin GroES
MFKPLSDNVIIDPTMASETQTQGGLFIPETAQANGAITTGKVVAVGNGHIYDSGQIGPMFVQKGDTVWYAKAHASTITLDGKAYKVVAQRNLFGYTE